MQSLTHLLSTFTSASVETGPQTNKPISNSAYLIFMSPFLLSSYRNRSNNISLILRIPKVKAPGYSRALFIFYLLVPRSSDSAERTPGSPGKDFLVDQGKVQISRAFSLTEERSLNNKRPYCLPLSATFDGNSSKESCWRL